MSGTVSAIHIYPIKSCRSIALDSAEVTVSGLAGDRRYQVVDDEGAPVTQRQKATLATVQPSLIEGGVRLEAEGRPALDVATPTSADTTAKSLIGVSIEAGDAGDDAAAWLTELLGSTARLVAMIDPDGYAPPLPGIDLRVGWADLASVLLANQASLDWLVERADAPFGMDRFRPNITISGVEPWDEDTWRDVSVGAARFGLGAPWPRCAIPQIDQLDGSRHKEPAKVLKAHRWCTDATGFEEPIKSFFEGNAMFGIGCSVLDAGATISVGDALTVNETGDRLIPAPT